MRVAKYNTKTKKPMQAPPQTEILTAPFGQPAGSQKQGEMGEGFETMGKPQWRQIGPPWGFGTAGLFHTLK